MAHDRKPSHLRGASRTAKYFGITLQQYAAFAAVVLVAAPVVFASVASVGVAAVVAAISVAACVLVVAVLVFVVLAVVVCVGGRAHGHVSVRNRGSHRHHHHPEHPLR